MDSGCPSWRGKIGAHEESTSHFGTEVGAAGGFDERAPVPRVGPDLRAVGPPAFCEGEDFGAGCRTSPEARACPASKAEATVELGAMPALVCKRGPRRIWYLTGPPLPMRSGAVARSGGTSMPLSGSFLMIASRMNWERLG